MVRTMKNSAYVVDGQWVDYSVIGRLKFPEHRVSRGLVLQTEKHVRG